MSIAKKIFIISSVLLASVLFFIGIYNVSFKEKNTSSKSLENEISKTTSENEEKSTMEKLAEKVGFSKNKNKIYTLSDEAVISPAITDGGEKISYYTKAQGNVLKVSLNGEDKETVSRNSLSGLEKVFWSSDGSKVLARFNNNGKIEYSSYDYKAKKGFR